MAHDELPPIQNLLQSLVIDLEKWKEQKGDNNLLLEVSLNEILYAPISKSQLKIALEPFLPQDLMGLFIRPYSLFFPDQEWADYYSHPYFQRRKPQLVPESRAPAENQYWVLMDGQKQGPFPTDQLSPSLEEKKMAYTDLISFDNGHSWSKAYEYQGLNRRTKELPKRPLTHETIEKSEVEATLCISLKEEVSAASGGLMSLIAFIAGKRRKKMNETWSSDERPENQELFENELKGGQSFYSKVFYVLHYLFFKQKKNVAIAGSLLLIFLFVSKKIFTKQQDNTGHAPTIEDTNHPYRNDRVHAPREITNNGRRAPDREDVKPQPSFKRSRPFRSIASEEETSSSEQQDSSAERSPSELEANEDRGDTPVEQDEIREKLSKETIDPIETEPTEAPPADPPPATPEE